MYSSFLSAMRKSSRHPNKFFTFSFRTEYLKNSFFSDVVNNWNRLDSDICDSSNYSIFLKSIPKFIRPVKIKLYRINDSVGIKLPTRLSFSHLRKNKFRHNFKNMLNPLCSCSIEPANTTHFFPLCHFCN